MDRRTSLAGKIKRRMSVFEDVELSDSEDAPVVKMDTSSVSKTYKRQPSTIRNKEIINRLSRQATLSSGTEVTLESKMARSPTRFDERDTDGGKVTDRWRAGSRGRSSERGHYDNDGRASLVTGRAPASEYHESHDVVEREVGHVDATTGEVSDRRFYSSRTTRREHVRKNSDGGIDRDNIEEYESASRESEGLDDTVEKASLLDPSVDEDGAGARRTRRKSVRIDDRSTEFGGDDDAETNPPSDGNDEHDGRVDNSTGGHTVKNGGSRRLLRQLSGRKFIEYEVEQITQPDRAFGSTVTVDRSEGDETEASIDERSIEGGVVSSRSVNDGSIDVGSEAEASLKDEGTYANKKPSITERFKSVWSTGTKRWRRKDSTLPDVVSGADNEQRWSSRRTSAVSVGTSDKNDEPVGEVSIRRPWQSRSKSAVESGRGDNKETSTLTTRTLSPRGTYDVDENKTEEKEEPAEEFGFRRTWSSRSRSAAADEKQTRVKEAPPEEAGGKDFVGYSYPQFRRAMSYRPRQPQPEYQPSEGSERPLVGSAVADHTDTESTDPGSVDLDQGDYIVEEPTARDGGEELGSVGEEEVSEGEARMEEEEETETIGEGTVTDEDDGDAYDEKANATDKGSPSVEGREDTPLSTKLSLLSKYDRLGYPSHKV